MSATTRDSAPTTVIMEVGSGRPVAIRTGTTDLTVDTIVSVRDETFAYPIQTGPRTVFSVRADGRPFRLVHRHQARDWTVEAIEDMGAELATAA